MCDRHMPFKRVEPLLTEEMCFDQVWHDYRLMWNPEEYEGIKKIRLPTQHIWLPDIVLYNKYVALF